MTGLLRPWVPVRGMSHECSSWFDYVVCSARFQFFFCRFCDCHQKREFSSVSFSGELVESCSWFDCVDCFAYLFLIRS